MAQWIERLSPEREIMGSSPIDPPLQCSCSSVVRALVLHTRSRWFESIHEHVGLSQTKTSIVLVVNNWVTLQFVRRMFVVN